METLYPEDGLVLRVVGRDQKRVRWPDSNLDYAWFRKEEARAFLPAKPKKDAQHEVPRELVQRLARFHLIDYVYALNYTFFPKEAIEELGGLDPEEHHAKRLFLLALSRAAADAAHESG